jgi:hypothetical protein
MSMTTTAQMADGSPVRLGMLVRVDGEKGRGTVFALSPLGGYATVKMLATGRKLQVRVTALKTGALS